MTAVWMAVTLPSIVLTMHLPAGYRLVSAEVGGEQVEIANQAETATVRLVPSATKSVAWKIHFGK
jgi:hypothetical protein